MDIPHPSGAHSPPRPDHTIINIPEYATESIYTVESWAAFLTRHAQNAGWIITRNAVSVAIPTFVREVVRRALFAKIPAGIYGKFLGSTAGYLPVLLQGYGLYRDCTQHTHTRYTIIGRTLAIMISAGSVTCLIALGTMSPAAASALAASNFVYAPLRDIAQNYFRADNNTDPQSVQFAMWPSSLLYGVNQFGVNEGMQYLSDAFTAYMPVPLANGIGRAAVNVVGESVDDFSMLNLQANYQRTKLKVQRPRISWPSQHSWNDAEDRLLNVHAGRSSLLTGLFSSAFIADHFSGDNLESESMAVGFSAFLGYLGFMSGTMQTAPRHSYDLEAGMQMRAPSSEPVGLSIRRVDETRF